MYLSICVCVQTPRAELRASLSAARGTFRPLRINVIAVVLLSLSFIAALSLSVFWSANLCAISASMGAWSSRHRPPPPPSPSRNPARKIAVLRVKTVTWPVRGIIILIRSRNHLSDCLNDRYTRYNVNATNSDRVKSFTTFLFNTALATIRFCPRIKILTNRLIGPIMRFDYSTNGR